MKVRHNYIIRDLLSGGYWSNEHKSFKGFIFASQYSEKIDAEHVILDEILSKVSNHVELVKHYTR